MKMNDVRSAFSKLGLSLGLVLWGARAAMAIQTADGTTYFSHVPVLGEAEVQPSVANTSGATIRINISVPKDDDLAVQRLTINQAENPDQLDLAPSQVSVRQDNVPLEAQVQVEPQNGLISLIFAKPIPAGSAITLVIKPSYTPRSPGSYLYGLAAQPTGDKPFTYFLGYSRIVLADPNDHGDTSFF